MPRTNRQQGFGLLEFLMVVGLVGAAAVMTMSYFKKTQADSRAQTFISDVAAIESVIFQLSGGEHRYNEITIDALVRSKMLPPRMVVEGNTGDGDASRIITPWGTSFAIRAINQDGGTSNGYELSVPAPPPSECHSAALAFLDGFRDVTVGSSSVKSAANPAQQAAALCKTSADGVRRGQLALTGGKPGAPSPASGGDETFDPDPPHIPDPPPHTSF